VRAAEGCADALDKAHANALAAQSLLRTSASGPSPDSTATRRADRHIGSGTVVQLLADVE
jgi:hypothetical protein